MMRVSPEEEDQGGYTPYKDKVHHPDNTPEGIKMKASDDTSADGVSVIDDTTSVQSSDDEPSSLEQCMTSQPMQITMFVIMVVFGLLCVIFDWLWLSDEMTREKGLVFGPADDGILITLFIIVIIGTCAYIIEITGEILVNCGGRRLLDEQIMSLITMFVDEVPNVTLNVMLAACREVPTSYYALIKAVLNMIGAFIRSIKVIRGYFSTRKRGGKTGLGWWILRTVILAAAVYILFAAIMVFVFTYSDPDDGFSSPDSLTGKNYNSQRYFYMAGVYFSHPLFSLCYDQTQPWNEKRIHWMKLDGIYQMLDSVDTKFRFYGDETESIAYIYTDIEGKVTEDCYHTSHADCSITRIDPSICDPVDIDDLVIIEIQFGMEEDSKRKVFGDVLFKGTLWHNGTCDYLSVSDFGLLHNNETAYGQLQYFQMYEDVNETTHFYYDPDIGDFRHYLYDQEMPNVSEMWKTGYRECDMSGSYNPTLDRSLELECTWGRGSLMRVSVLLRLVIMLVTWYQNRPF